MPQPTQTRAARLKRSASLNAQPRIRTASANRRDRRASRARSNTPDVSTVNANPSSKCSGSSHTVHWDGWVVGVGGFGGTKSKPYFGSIRTSDLPIQSTSSR